MLTETIAPYVQRYLDRVPNGRIADLLRAREERIAPFLQDIPTDRWQYRYAEEKWTLLQSWLHVSDSERIFAARALRIARGDATPLPGFDQDEFAVRSGFETRSPESVLAEYASVRAATLSLFEHLSPEALEATGTFSGHSYRAETVARIILGHELHHVELTNERYL